MIHPSYDKPIAFIHISHQDFENFLWLFFSFLAIYILTHIPFLTSKLKNKFKDKKFSFIFGFISSTLLLSLLLGSLHYLREQHTTYEIIEEYVVFKAQIEDEQDNKEQKENKTENVVTDNLKFEKVILINIMHGIYIAAILFLLILTFIYSKNKNNLALGFSLPLLVFVAYPFVTLLFSFFDFIFEHFLKDPAISSFILLIFLAFLYNSFKYIRKFYYKIFNNGFSIFKLILFIIAILAVLFTPIIFLSFFHNVASIFMLFTIKPDETFYYHQNIFTTSGFSILLLFLFCKIFDFIYISLNIKSKTDSVIWGFISTFYSLGLASFFISLSLKLNYTSDIREHIRNSEISHHYKLPNYIFNISIDYVNTIALLVLSAIIIYSIYIFKHFKRNKNPVLIGKLIFVSIFTVIFIWLNIDNLMFLI